MVTAIHQWVKYVLYLIFIPKQENTSGYWDFLVGCLWRKPGSTEDNDNDNDNAPINIIRTMFHAIHFFSFSVSLSAGTDQPIPGCFLLGMLATSALWHRTVSTAVLGGLHHLVWWECSGCRSGQNGNTAPWS